MKKAEESRKEYVQNEDIKNFINNLLNNFFILEDSKLPEQEFLTKFYNKSTQIIDFFTNDDRLIHIYAHKFMINLKNI